MNWTQKATQYFSKTKSFFKEEFKYPVPSIIKFSNNKKVFISFIILLAIFISLLFIKNTAQLKEISKQVKASEKTEISLPKQATLDIPKDSLKQDTQVTIKNVPPPKLESKNLKYAGKTYEFHSSQAKFDKPVIITLVYDPSALSDKSMEDRVFIATWENNQWKPLEGSVINKSNHTVSAAVDHFSLFTSLFDAVGEAWSKITQYSINQVSYSDLPSQIKNDLTDWGFTQNDVFLIEKVEIPTGIKLSSLTITAANGISKVTGVLIGGTQSKEKAGKAVAETLGKEIVKTQGKEGQLLVKVYKLGKGAQLIEQLATNAYPLVLGIKTATKLPVIYASAVSWILSAEMDYINDHLDEAYSDIWKFNFAEGEKLIVYQVVVASQTNAPLGSAFEQRGVKYYYYDTKQNKYINYYDKLAGSTLELQIKGEETKESSLTPGAESVEFPPVYPGAVKVGREFEYEAIGDKPLESCQAYAVEETNPGNIDNWYKDKFSGSGWKMVYGDQVVDFRRPPDESFAVQVVGQSDWNTLPLFKKIPDKRDLASDEVGFLLCWSKQVKVTEKPTVPTVTPKSEAEKITTVAEFDKLSLSQCYEKLKPMIIMKVKITEAYGFTPPAVGFVGHDETGTVYINAEKEGKFLEVGKTYILKGCKNNIGGDEKTAQPIFVIDLDLPDAIQIVGK